MFLAFTALDGVCFYSLTGELVFWMVLVFCMQFSTISNCI